MRAMFALLRGGGSCVGRLIWVLKSGMLRGCVAILPGAVFCGGICWLCSCCVVIRFFVQVAVKKVSVATSTEYKDMVIARTTNMTFVALLHTRYV